MDDLGEFLRDRLAQEYGQAVDQLPFESAEGGYQGWHADAYDMIFDEGVIELARHSDELLEDLVQAIDSDAIFCDYDWLSLDDDDVLSFSWSSFCKTVKHHRHFFFQKLGGEEDDRELFDPITLMARIARHCETHGLLQVWAQDFEVYRARARSLGQTWTSVGELGPPPEEYAVQFNRMNPPGVPVMYVSETRALSIAEVRDGVASIGRWRFTRPVRILNLVDLPANPGLFSTLDRKDRLGLRFLHQFVHAITQPVAGDAVVKLDYIPTQVLTEFLRDFPFKAGTIDGVRYPSATGITGANIVLFATQHDVLAVDDVAVESAWLELTAVEQLG